jgi:hypothetical protein
MGLRDSNGYDRPRIGTSPVRARNILAGDRRLGDDNDVVCVRRTDGKVVLTLQGTGREVTYGEDEWVDVWR